MRMLLAVVVVLAGLSAACGDVVTSPSAVPAGNSGTQAQADNIVWGS